MRPNGFGGEFTLLFDDDPPASPSLPGPFREAYAGDWRPPEPPGRPYTFVNFVTSRDGRVSFAEPGHAGGGDVSGFSAADRWLMGLLRARADAVLVGAGTLAAEPDHIWTPDHIFPEDSQAFAWLRRAEGLAPEPLHVFLSHDGRLDPAAAALSRAGLRALVATTDAGRREAEARLRGCAADVEALGLGESQVDLGRLAATLRERGVRRLLCEGGPRVYGALLAAGLVDDEFLTLSPLAVGEAPGRPRPSLVEGAAFEPGRAPRARPLSLRRCGDHLFMRSRWAYPEPGA